MEECAVQCQEREKHFEDPFMFCFCETMRKGPLTRTAMARERSEGSWEGIWVHCRTFFADGGDES